MVSVAVDDLQFGVFRLSICVFLFFFFSSRRRHTRSLCDWSSDVCSSDLLFILADSGGGNSARSRGWPYHLQQKLVNPHRLTVTVSHYLPGASKWNPIDRKSVV